MLDKVIGTQPKTIKEAGDYQRDHGPAVLEEVGDRVGLELRVDHHHDGADLQDAEQRRDVVGSVGQSDDHPLFRRGIISLLETLDAVTVVGDAATTEEALELVATAAPDVVLMDLDLGGESGIDATKAPAYLALPNVACVGGSWMLPSDAVKAGDWQRIGDLAHEAAALRR